MFCMEEKQKIIENSESSDFENPNTGEIFISKDDLFAGDAKLPEVNSEIESMSVNDEPIIAPLPPELAAKSDTANEQFNPEIHAINKDGTPKLKKDGTFAKKRGRKSGAQTKSISSDQSVKYENVQLVAGAQIIVGSVDSAINALLMVKASDEERAMLCDAWIGYLESLEMDDLPPWLLLAMSNVMVYAPKMTQPEPVKRIDKIRFGISHLWNKFFGKKTKEIKNDDQEENND